MRTTLSALQAALCVVLLIGAGLFVRSLARSRAVDLGFQPNRVLRVYPDFSLEGLQGDARKQAKARNEATLRESAEALRRLPWVENVGLSVGSPFGFAFGVDVKMPGRDSLPTVNGSQPHITAVDAGYFATVGTPLRAGRIFTPADRDGSTLVVIVNETMGRALWPGDNPLGKCLQIGDAPPNSVVPCSSVVGVVGDVHLSSLREKPSMQYYIPLGQERGIGGYSMLMRPRGDAREALPLLRDALISMPDMPYSVIKVLQEVLDPQYRPWKLGAAMFGVFGVLALVIAAVGLYSVIAYLVADRTRELGVRIALGATGGRIEREVVFGGVRVAALGVAVGVGIALMAARFVEPLLFDMKARDPIVFSSVAAVVLLIAAIAAWWPARRASRVDPIIALRAD